MKMILRVSLLSLLVVGVSITATYKVKSKVRNDVPLILLTTRDTSSAQYSADSLISIDPSDDKGHVRITRNNLSQIITTDEKNNSLKTSYQLSQKISAMTVSKNGESFLSDGSKIRVIGNNGQEIRSFHAPQTSSIALLNDGSIAMGWVPGNQSIHVYSSEGRWLRSFGEIKQFDLTNVQQNEFLNKGRLLTDKSDNIYNVSLFAPVPSVRKYSKDGELLKEFTIEGTAIDLQKEYTAKYLNSKNSKQIGSFHLITSAAFDNSKDHLWIGLNGSNKTGIIYEYDTNGRKLAEYALNIQSTTSDGGETLTGVKDLAVQYPVLWVMTWDGRVHNFDLSSGQQIGKTSSRETNLVSNLATSKGFMPLINNQATFPNCAQAQSANSCSLTCANGGSTLDCMATLTATVNGNAERITSSSCSTTPSSAISPGGCSATLTTCNQQGTSITRSTGSSCPACSPSAPPTPQNPPCTWNASTCRYTCPPPTSPIIIDVTGDGFDLTDLAGGIRFDLDGNGVKEKLSWTDANSGNAFLALDRNNNGTIDNGLELFGNYTPQPASATPNGYLALAEYDKLVNGGNNDGVIDSRDLIYNRLRLWQDNNHDGISESNELKSLPMLNVQSISLNYKESKRRDEYGNEFRYRAKVDGNNGSNLGRWSYDVFLLSEN